VTVAEFLASPTWLDNQDLVPGGNALQQGNELFNQLLKASAWASRCAEQPLHARTGYTQDRAPVDRWGNVYVVPDARPIRAVNGFAWGYSFQDLNILNSPSSQTWIEKGETIVFQLSTSSTPGLASQQFGRVHPRIDSVFYQCSYVAGYCNTTLAAPATAGATSITLTDPTGLQPAVTGGLLGTIPGSVGRIWEPVNSTGTSGGEEAFQVSASWTGGNPVLLAAPLVNNHAAGAGVSELPPEVHQAVISLTVALLCREDVSNDEPYSATPFGPTVRRSKRGGKAGGLVDHAESILHRYKPRVH
jgi:hypothetical protein